MNKRMWTMGLLSLALAGGAVIAGCSDKKEDAAAASGSASPNTPEVRRDISVMLYDRGRVPADQGTIESNRWTKWINEQGPANVKFVAIPRYESADKLNVLYASGSAPDLIMEFSQKIRDPLYQQKQLLPLDDLIAQHSVEYKKFMEDNPILKKAGTMADGKMYYFGKLNYVTPNRGFLIRTDWLKKLGLEMPKTTEDLYKVVKAFAEQDPDGNGKKDTYGISLAGDTGFALRQTFGVTTRWEVKNNEAVIFWDRFVHFNTFAQKVYQDGSIDRDFPTDGNGARTKQDFISGKLGIYGFLLNPVQVQLQLIDPLKKNLPAAEVAFLAYPESPAGAFLPTLTNPVQMPGAVSATAKHPEAVMKYVDFLIKDSTYQTLKYGEEGTHYKMVNGCPEVTDATKLQKEVTYLADDMLMIGGTSEFSKCNMPLVQYQSDSRKQEYQDIFDSYMSTYMSFDRKYPEITLSELMPTLPLELSTIESNAGKAIDDIWLKAVVDGGKYTIDQALKDAQNEWSKAGGKQVEDWYRSWYQTDKDKAILFKDVQEIAKTTYADYKKIRAELK
ncbi:extracellular solute-binding protein [Paenibacillus sp. YN15]|uniref:extracellular solute-binding protein n=1 Tax=Paenibacillus sp. YN15 TaxID=1742774 RepID=UPI000DCAF464|nr:extracellular solute-binding protein [Paenibacillus sp. YN15]RAU97314.1 ABC transporter substrate-binding protein [Paenibacillus sp. YN15]